MSSYDHPEPDYPIVPDYCDCGQHVDEHDDELHNMRMDRHAPSGRLFATAAELSAPPVAHGDADLSRIRVLDRESPEGQEELRKRAARKAKRDRINGTFDMTELGAL